MQNVLARFHAPLVAEFRFSRDLESDLIRALELARKVQNSGRAARLESYLRHKFGWSGSMTLPTFGSTPDKRIAELLKAPIDLGANVLPPPPPVPETDVIDKAIVKVLRIKPGKPRARAPRNVLVAQGGRRKRTPDLDAERVPAGLGMITSDNLSVRRHLTDMDQSPRLNELQVVAGAGIGNVIALPARTPISMVCRVVPDHKNACWFKTRPEAVILWDRAENTYRVNESPRRGRGINVTHRQIQDLAGAWGARVV